MILASKGFDVTIYERNGTVGGRNRNIRVGSSNFDVGPTMLMMKFVLDKCFQGTIYMPRTNCCLLHFCFHQDLLTIMILVWYLHRFWQKR